MKKYMIFSRVLILFLAIGSIAYCTSYADAAKKKDKGKPVVTISVSTKKLTKSNVKVTVKIKKGTKLRSVLWKTGKSKSAALSKWKKGKNIIKKKTFTVKANGWYSIRVQGKNGKVTHRTIKIGNIDKTIPTQSATYSVTNKVGTVVFSASDASGISFTGFAKGALTSKSTAMYTPVNGQFTVDTPGYYTICVRDGVGNVSLNQVYVELWKDLWSVPLFDKYGAKHCEGTFLDRWKNSFTNPLGICPSSSGESFAEYYLNGEYRKLSGSIIRGYGVSENDTVWLQILADDVVVYESPKIDYKTQTITFDIDIGNAKYVKIKAISMRYNMYNAWDSSYMGSLYTHSEGLYITDAQLYN